MIVLLLLLLVLWQLLLLMLLLLPESVGWNLSLNALFGCSEPCFMHSQFVIWFSFLIVVIVVVVI